jgi:hypothetical protein
MRKVWVLDTSTKGTGATVVPLESTLREPEAAARTPYVAPKAPRPKPEKEPAPRLPRRFKVVDVVSRETLADGTRMRATLEALEDVRSPVDVRIFVWDDEDETWDLLTLVEQRAMWDASRRLPSPRARDQV